jgi:hypothetical protein
VESELYAGGWTDMTKVRVAFRDFVNAPKNCNNLKGILATSLQTLPFLLEQKHNIRQHKPNKINSLCDETKNQFEHAV